jgi:hypothetical protein
MKTQKQPEALPRSEVFSLAVNGWSLDVLHTGVADFAVCELETDDWPAEVEVVVRAPVPSACLHPRSRGLEARVDGNRVVFRVDGPQKLSVAVGGCKPLYFFAGRAGATSLPAGGAGVIELAPGRVHEHELLTLEDGQTLHLPLGAVLRGRIHVRGRHGIRICGSGIFEGPPDGPAAPSIVLERCEDVVVEGLTMVRPRSWMLVPAACRGVTVRDVRQIGEVMSSDGIDVLGSSRVLIEDCFLHNNDDCVAIKAFLLGARNVEGVEIDARENVEEVTVRRCTLANWHGGNAMEIGHELSVGSVRHIRFEDIDVLHVHGTGAVFAIHNGDRARVEDVVFENIRIEHCYDKLIDIRIIESRFSSDRERGTIRNVRLDNIHWHRTPANAGYTVSLVGGADAAHRVEGVSIGRFFIDGRRVTDPDELGIHTRHCGDLSFPGMPGVEKP